LRPQILKNYRLYEIWIGLFTLKMIKPVANDDTNGFYLIPQFDDTLPNFEAQYFIAEFDLQEL